MCAFNTLTDQEGYLLKLSDWTPEVAEQIARAENIVLGADHWELIHLIQQYYLAYDHSPSMRPLIKYTATHLGADKGRSIHLLTLFPGSPPKILAKISGLPKPPNCL
jgi:tRNA 2-thiouridine synthesizing protein E